MYTATTWLYTYWHTLSLPDALPISQALEFDLQPDGVVHLAGAVAHVAAGDQASGQAAAVPLHAGDAFEHLLVLDRVVVAAHQAPRRVDWIQERQIGLFEQVLPVPGDRQSKRLNSSH